MSRGACPEFALAREISSRRRRPLERNSRTGSAAIPDSETGKFEFSTVKFRLRLLGTGLRLLSVGRLRLTLTICIRTAAPRGERAGILSVVWVLGVNFLPRLPGGLAAGGAHGHLNFAADLRHFGRNLLPER